MKYLSAYPSFQSASLEWDLRLCVSGVNPDADGDAIDAYGDDGGGGGDDDPRTTSGKTLI